MNRQSLIKTLLINVFLLALASMTFGASLELGQVRANRRGWDDKEAKSGSGTATTEEAASYSNETYVTEEVASDEIAAYHVNNGVAETDKPKRTKRVRGSSKRGSGLILIGGNRKKGPSLRDGYLAVDVPPALRFSDIDPINDRPPSPALPEFNFVASEYMPYLIETELSEDALNDAALLSEIVIELATHEVISGQIETRSSAQDEVVEHFNLEEQRTTVLRPEEVLIFFETDTNVGKTKTIVPFSPATPSTIPSGGTPAKSSATLIKE